VKRAAAFLLFFVSLWWLWQLLVGVWSHYDWIAAVGAAAVAGALAELAATRTDGRTRLPFAVLRGMPSALAMVFVDFALVMWALAQRRQGVVRRTKFPHPDAEAFRTWAAIVGDWSPNAYVIDIDDGTTITHHLVRNEQSQRPA